MLYGQVSEHLSNYMRIKKYLVNNILVNKFGEFSKVKVLLKSPKLDIFDEIFKEMYNFSLSNSGVVFKCL